MVLIGAPLSNLHFLPHQVYHSQLYPIICRAHVWAAAIVASGGVAVMCCRRAAGLPNARLMWRGCSTNRSGRVPRWCPIYPRHLASTCTCTVLVTGSTILSSTEINYCLHVPHYRKTIFKKFTNTLCGIQNSPHLYTVTGHNHSQVSARQPHIQFAKQYSGKMKK